MLAAVDSLWSMAAEMRWKRWARRIRVDAEKLRDASDRTLRDSFDEMRYQAHSGTALLSLLRPVFAVVCEAARRHLGMTPFETQILGGIVLHFGHVAEMQTGEGKTLTATFPLVLQTLRGRPVHLATANDYLARRDADGMRPVYESLGLTVGVITGEQPHAERRRAYDCDITCGTAREFGFDFLRDRLTLRSSGRDSSPLFSELIMNGTVSVSERPTLQRYPLSYLLLDEADSLLIDEARTPLIISNVSGDQESDEALFRWCSLIAGEFRDGREIENDPDTGIRRLTNEGLFRLRQLARPDALNRFPLSEIVQSVVRAVHVRETLQRDQQYVIRDGRVEIVDEYTGRIAEGRRWRNGIHQAVEAQEGVALSPLTSHCARITLPELLGQYESVAGMTGTAATAAREFRRVYGLQVVRIPTRLPSRRRMLSPRVFASAEKRWAAMLDEIRDVIREDRPVLIGTRTIDQSYELSSRLRAVGIEHEVLNARNHAREAAIISEAGRPRQVTVATNMAGRGTDIQLQDHVAEQGGLHVICAEQHASTRVDLQLAGRCARQGDPGSFRQYMSLDDEVFRLGLESGIIMKPTTLSESRLDVLAADFLRAQRFVERQHEEDRRLVQTHSEQLARQLRNLGQDPFLDAV